jgi:hypothetical protein
MTMLRSLLLFLTVAGASVLAQTDPAGELVGRVEGKTYVSPTGAFRIVVPVLPELGGRIIDTNNVVTFQDDFNVLCTIAAFPMDATQRWEHSTREPKDYLSYFFVNFIMPDFQRTFPGARVESARFSPSVAGGALFAYTLLPGGSMFSQKLSFVGTDDKVPDAKRGNMTFVRGSWIFVVSVELAERVIERSTYHKTPQEEDDLLRQRLVDLFDKLQFTENPASAK